MRKYRGENRSIIYLDETYDTHDINNKGWVDSCNECRTKVPSNEEQCIRIIHAQSKEGWIPYVFL